MATLDILEQENKTQEELTLINNIYEAITNEDGVLLADDIREYILNFFQQNSKQVLQTKGTPLYLLLSAVVSLSQGISLGLCNYPRRFLYTQSSGEDLSLTAANFGFTRIEAKKSTLVAVMTASKALTMSANTSFTDGAGNVWLTVEETDLSKDTPARITLQSKETGIVNYISPLEPTNVIANLSAYEVDTSSIVVGRDQESDTEFKSVISSGINIFGSDDKCKRELLTNQMVLSAFCYTNYDLNKSINKLNVNVDSGQRFICVRVSNENITQEEADLIAQTISTNTIFSGNYQRPADGMVKFYFGLTETQLTDTLENGGAGLTGVSDTSNCVIVRQTGIYGNFVDVLFYIAKSTNIQCKLEIRYVGNYTNTEKENMSGDIKSKITQAIAEISQVGASILISDIAERLLTTTDLGDKLTIRSILLKKYVESEADSETGWSQSLDADSNEYFKVYSTDANIYAGISIQES